MKSIYQKLLHGFFAFSSVLGSSQYASADDTEIFFGAPSGNGIIPNVLFILDNSGSMRTNITTQSTYDNSINYTGNYPDQYIYVFNSKFSYQGVIVKSKTHCQDMLDKLNSTGQYISSKVASYNGTRWNDLSFSGGIDNDPTECKGDRGVHGENASSSNTYARNGKNKPMWTSNSNQEVDWSKIDTYDYYSANYVNWYVYHRTSTSQSRLDIMKNVVSNLVNSTSGINIGLMSFNTNNGGKQGGRVNVPLGYIDSTRAAFNSSLNSFNPDTWTPLAETLFEAMRYYEGGNVFLGSQSVADSKDPSNSSKYKSPIVSECQPNNIVLLTDGEPTYDAYQSGDYDSNDAISRGVIQSRIGSCSGNCLDEVAKYMYDNDLRSDLLDRQFVKTYTIGFNINHPFLKETAEGDGVNNKGGGGQYFTADDTAQLDAALKSIISSVKKTNTTFVTPGVAVNSFNRLNHRDELYFSVFAPADEPQWLGNLKRYRLGSDGVIYDNDQTKTAPDGKKGKPAIDGSTGYFSSGSISWWSASVDGDSVGLGGAAESLPSNNADRNVFTYITGNSKNLNDSNNEVSAANKSKLSKSLLGIPAASDAEHEKLLSWIRGLDVNDEDTDGDKTDARKVLMDPLHSPPVVVIYGGTNSAPDTTVFFSDNQGFIHAINAGTGNASGYGNSPGEEHFAFIPEDLLKNQTILYENDLSTDHPYGMDGAIAAWTHDDNGNNQLTDAGDFVHIYSGMRRGGRNYYALDVTDRSAPKMLWQIKGGVTSGFEELGQTWSRPVKTKVKINNTVKDVLIFSGGYDEDQDDVSTRTVDDIGRAIYIVDAKTGARLWAGGISGTSSSFNKTFNDMKYSIPSNIKVIDVNGDLLADQMYVGDMGGQVWRFDINNGSNTNALVDGAVIASLADNSTAGNRRFYHEPDVSVLNKGGVRKLAIAIGSGWQAHPLATSTEDRFYLITDPNLYEKPMDANGNVNYPLYTESSLYDATDNHLGHVSAVNTLAQQTQAYSDLGNSSGWYIRLTRSGEKVLASSLTVGGELFFTTYEPVPNANSCKASAGTPRLFHINLEDATPVKNYDGIGADNELTRPDREVKLQTTSLPTSPQRLRIDGKDVLCVGTECQPLQTGESILKTYWLEEE